MTAPGGGGGDINLATLWIPVAPDTSHIGEAMRRAGEEGRREFTSGFNAGGIGNDLTKGITQGLQQANLPGMFDPVINAISGKQALLIGAVSGAVSAGLNLVVSGIETLVSAVERGVETAVATVMKLGEEFEHINDELLLFSTNAAALKGDALEVLNNLDASSTHLGQDLALLNDRLGLTGDQLDTMARHVDILRDRLGALDVDNLTQSMNAFGVSTDQADKQLNFLLQTQQQFGVNMNVIIDQLGKQSQSFIDLGLSYEQSVYMLGELDSKMRSAADGIEKMTAMAEKNAATRHETLQQYITDETAMIEHYRDIGREDLAQQEAASAFSARRWQEGLAFGKALQDTLRQPPDALKGQSDAIDKVAEATKHLHQAWEGFHNKLMVDLGPIGERINDTLGAGLDHVKAWFDQNHQEIIDKIKEYGDKFIDTLPQIRNFAADFIDLLGPVADVLQYIGKYITQLAAGVLIVTGHLKDGKQLWDEAEKFGQIDLDKVFGAAADKVRSINIDTEGIKKNLNDAADAAGRLGSISPSMPGVSIPPGNFGPAPVVPGTAPGIGPIPVPPALTHPTAPSAPSRAPSLPPQFQPPADSQPGHPLQATTSGYWLPAGTDQGSTGVPGAVLTGSHALLPGLPGTSPAPGGRSSSEQRRRQERLQDTQDELADANAALVAAQRKEAEASQKLVDAQKAASDQGLIPGSEEYNKRQKALADATEQHDAALRELNKSTHHQAHTQDSLSDAQDDLTKPLKGGARGGAAGGAGAGAAQQLGSGLLSGLGQELGLGDIFAKPPTEWGAVKLATGLADYGFNLANWFGDVMGGGGQGGTGEGGDTGGSGGGGGGGGLFGGGGLGGLFGGIFGGGKGGGAGTVPGAPPGALPGTAPAPQPAAPGASPQGPGPVASPYYAMRPGTPQIPPGVHLSSATAPAGGPNAGQGPEHVFWPGGSAAPITQGAGGAPAVQTATLTGAHMPAGVPMGAGHPMAAPTGTDKASTANYVYQAALSRGYSPDEATAVVGYAVGESGLNPAVSGGPQGGAGAANEVIGLFQEKPGFAAAGGVDPSQRSTVAGNTEAYLNNLGKHRGQGDIYSQLLATSAGGPIATGGRAAMPPLIRQAQGLIGAAGGDGAIGGSIGAGADAPTALAPFVQQPYGLPKGTDIRPGAPGFPSWMTQLGAQFGVVPTTYAGHQEGAGVNQGVDWWPAGAKQDMSGASYTPEQTQRLQAWAQYQESVMPTNDPRGQTIYMNPTTGQKFGVAQGQIVGPGTNQPQYYGGDWSGHTGHVHTRFSVSEPLPGQAGAPLSMGVSPPPPLDAPPGQGSGVTNAPNVAPSSSFEKSSVSGLVSGLGGVFGAAAQDWNPRSAAGILHQPVHNDNSINISGNTIADPSSLQQSIKNEQNSRFYTVAGGLPYPSVGAP
jgi:hypothetical protein